MLDATGAGSGLDIRGGASKLEFSGTTNAKESRVPPQLLVDPSTYDLNKVIMTLEEIRKYNAQRFEMEQLSGVLKFDADAGEIVC